MTRHKTRTTRLGAMLIAVGLFAGCASEPKPKILHDATERIAHSDTQELETLQPRLIREAKQHEIAARAAYERRDYDEAKLHAHLAIQRYETARNLVKRDSAQSLAKNMAAADSDLAKEAQALAEERRELERYNALQQRFDDVQGDLAQVREEQRGAAAQAKRLLLRARTRQAEALGAGASSSAPAEYAQARLLVESSLEAFDSELYDESSRTSTEAIASFDKLIEQAADSDRAQRKKEEEQAAARAKAQSNESAAKKDAQAAIDEATDAQTAAIGARMPEKQAALYQQAQFLLQTAERRLRDEDYSGAKNKAMDSRDLFLQGAQDANVATTTPVGVAPEGATGSGSTGSSETRLAIQRAEDSRAAALLRGGTSADLQRGDYALELARQAAQRSDDARAIAKANEAASSYDAITGVAAAPLPTVAATTTSSQGSSSALKSKAEEMIVGLQLERAEALGKLADQRCPGTFREFEAVLELAQQRYDARDYAQAFEFAVRASERLNRCDDAPVAAAATSAAASAAPRKPTPEERAETKRRELAASALSQAQGDYAELSVEAPEDNRLRKPAVLIASSETWFNQRDYPQAEALAKRAIEDMKELRTALDKERAVAEAVESTKASSEKPVEATSTEKVTDARILEACKRVDTLAEQAKGAQLRASRQELDEANQERYRRAVRTLTRSNALREKEVCESAEILAEESLATFEELAMVREKPETSNPDNSNNTIASTRPDNTNNTDNTDKTDKKPDPGSDTTAQDQAAYEARASEAIASAKLARARAESQSDNNVYSTANSLLSEAERLSRKKQYAKAEGLARQAAGAFASLDVNATTTDSQGKRVDPAWKPAYSKVLDALILRDEVAGQIGEPERAVFDRGVRNMTRSRSAWDGKDFIAAGKFADAAREDFKEALAAYEKRRDSESDEAAKEAAAKKAAAEKAEREAKEKAERDAKLSKEAKEKAEREAKEKAEREAKEKAERDAKAAAALEKDARRAAEDAIREASIKQKLCGKERCDLRDENAMIRADELLQSAKRAMDSNDHPRAQKLAIEASDLYAATVKKQRAFFIPEGVTRVSRQGNKLSLSPRVKFNSGTTSLVAESLRSVDELARVLDANAGIIAKIELVGYTDDRGNDAKNLALSEQRAAAIKEELTKRGVDASKLTSLGRGEEDPITTNKTKEGRELNRRVEVIITFTDSQE